MREDPHEGIIKPSQMGRQLSSGGTRPPASRRNPRRGQGKWRIKVVRIKRRPPQALRNMRAYGEEVVGKRKCSTVHGDEAWSQARVHGSA